MVAAACAWAVVFAMKVAVLGFRSKTNPEPGQKWAFRDDCKGPWPARGCLPVTILDVRDGWVRYDMYAFKDQRMKLDNFARMYRRVDA